MSQLPDPESADYADALVTAEAQFLEGPFKGEKTKLYVFAMKNRKMNPKLLTVKEGQTVRVRLNPWAAARDANSLGSIMRLDEVEDLLLPEHWAVL